MHEDGNNPAEVSDAALLARIAAGDEDAFVALYRRYANGVHAFALALSKSRSVAQDVTQEVFLNALENAVRFDSAKGSARAWLFGCARHVVIDRLRHERRWTDEPPEASEPCMGEERLHTEQRLERLHAAIARLPMEYRETLVLCELQELSYAESAAVLRCPIGTVRSRLHRARAQLVLLLAETDATAERGAAAEQPGAGTSPRDFNPSEVCP